MGGEEGQKKIENVHANWNAIKRCGTKFTIKLSLSVRVVCNQTNCVTHAFECWLWLLLTLHKNLEGYTRWPFFLHSSFLIRQNVVMLRFGFNSLSIQSPSNQILCNRLNRIKQNNENIYYAKIFHSHSR